MQVQKPTQAVATKRSPNTMGVKRSIINIGSKIANKIITKIISAKQERSRIKNEALRNPNVNRSLAEDFPSITT